MQLVTPLRSAYWAHHGYQGRAALGRGSPASPTISAARANRVILIVVSSQGNCPDQVWARLSGQCSVFGGQPGRLPCLEPTGKVGPMGKPGRLGDFGRLERTDAGRAGKDNRSPGRIRKLGGAEGRERNEQRAWNTFDRRLIRLAHVDQEDLAGFHAAGDILGGKVLHLPTTEQTVHRLPPSCSATAHGEGAIFSQRIKTRPQHAGTTLAHGNCSEPTPPRCSSHRNS